MQAWRVEIVVRPAEADPAGEAAKKALIAAGLPVTSVRSRRGFLLGRELTAEQVQQFARSVLADPVLDLCELHPPGATDPAPQPGVQRVSVLLRPGVTDPVAHSVQKAMADMGLPAVAAATYRAYDVRGAIDAESLARAARKALANVVVQEVLPSRLPEALPGPGGAADLSVAPIPIAHLDRAGLERTSRDGGLALDGAEMEAIQRHFHALGREPSRTELETLAQTWSEHCKHKTLTGRVRFEGKVIDNLLKSTIAQVTRTLDRDFCVSVFVDNAGVIRFDDEDSVCIKVETHNRPSAA
jgi:phosphoribosylformylglycinamidine (FGAM) synthase PurS component